MKNIHIKNSRDFGRILKYVHDQFFALDEMVFDERSHTLTIPIQVISDEKINEKYIFPFRFWVNPVFSAVLKFRNVSGVSVTDNAKIGEADLNEIVAEDGKLKITCGIDVEIVIDVSYIDIELQITDHMVGGKKGFSLGIKG